MVDYIKLKGFDRGEPWRAICNDHLNIMMKCLETIFDWVERWQVGLGIFGFSLQLAISYEV